LNLIKRELPVADTFSQSASAGVGCSQKATLRFRHGWDTYQPDKGSNLRNKGGASALPLRLGGLALIEAREVRTLGVAATLGLQSGNVIFHIAQMAAKT
jgi:hypothetical protein